MLSLDDIALSSEELLATGMPAFLVYGTSDGPPASDTSDPSRVHDGETPEAVTLPDDGDQDTPSPRDNDFDYSVLGDNAGTAVRAAVEAMDTHLQRISLSIIEVGKHLIAIHDTMSKKQWGRWLALEYEAKRGQDRRTAQYRMQVARAFGDRADEVTGLPLRVLIALMDVARDVQDMVIAAHRGGQRITTTMAERIKSGEPAAIVLGLVPAEAEPAEKVSAVAVEMGGASHVEAAEETPAEAPEGVGMPDPIAEAEAAEASVPAPVEAYPTLVMEEVEEAGEEEGMPDPAAEADAAEEIDFNSDGLPSFIPGGVPAPLPPVDARLKPPAPQAQDDSGYELLVALKDERSDDKNNEQDALSGETVSSSVGRRQASENESEPEVSEPSPISFIRVDPARASEGLSMVAAMAERDIPALVTGVEDALRFLEATCQNGHASRVTKADSERLGKEAERLLEEAWRLTQLRPPAWLQQRQGLSVEVFSGPWADIGDGLHLLSVHWHEIKNFGSKPNLSRLNEARSLLRRGLTAQA